MIIKNNITAQITPKTRGYTFRETSFIELFLISQWHINKMPTSKSNFVTSKVSMFFSPLLFINNMEVIMFLAVENSRALKKTHVKLTMKFDIADYRLRAYLNEIYSVVFYLI